MEVAMKKTILVSTKSVKSRMGKMNLGKVSNHQWITVVNPTNRRLLLQACDDCGVVKSENSVQKMCRAEKGRALVSGDMQGNLMQVC